MNSLLDNTAPDERHQRVQQLVFTKVELLVQSKIVNIFNIVLVQILEVSLRKAICSLVFATLKTSFAYLSNASWKFLGVAGNRF
ncbi:hypothetical protein Tco_0888334 [Tanacetum coccineum]